MKTEKEINAELSRLFHTLIVIEETVHVVNAELAELRFSLETIKEKTETSKEAPVIEMDPDRISGAV